MLAEGRAVARDILRLLTVDTPVGLVLLPGATGFATPRDVVLNPSYYIFPAIRRLSLDLPDPAWRRLWLSGVMLLRDARFGRWMLPPDWLHVARATQEARPARAWPSRFSFDAVRVPLYLAWAGLGNHPAVTAVDRFWSAHPDEAVPAWADLETNDVAPFTQPAGMVAIRRYVGATLAGRVPVLPSMAAATDYYAGALTLLAHLALEPPLPTS